MNALEELLTTTLGCYQEKFNIDNDEMDEAYLRAWNWITSCHDMIAEYVDNYELEGVGMIEKNNVIEVIQDEIDYCKGQLEDCYHMIGRLQKEVSKPFPYRSGEIGSLCVELRKQTDRTCILDLKIDLLDGILNQVRNMEE